MTVAGLVTAIESICWLVGGHAR